MKSLFNLSALLLALALPMGTALAQDESTDDTSMEDDDGVMDDGAAEDGEASFSFGSATPVRHIPAGGDASSEPAAESESADSAGAYPLAAQSRPLTLPKGMIQISGSLAHVSLAFVDSSGGSTTSTATAMAAGGFYGVSDKIQVGAVTSLGIDPDVEWGEHLDLSGYYLVHDSEQLDVAAGVGIPLNFGDGDVLPGFTLDAYTRYIINDKISVNTGDNLLAIGIDPSAINLNMNIGGAFQATEQLSV
ncbi:MAG: hypothetical protein GY811_27515, partial [Myxococcales bacterium]|nr:hypothetical protein [Myxococcales bacterium]